MRASKWKAGTFLRVHVNFFSRLQTALLITDTNTEYTIWQLLMGQQVYSKLSKICNDLDLWDLILARARAHAQQLQFIDFLLQPTARSTLEIVIKGNFFLVHKVKAQFDYHGNFTGALIK